MENMEDTEKLPVVTEKETRPVRTKKKHRIPVSAWIAFLCAFLIAGVIVGYNCYHTVHGEDLGLLKTEIAPPTYGGYDGQGTVDEENFHPEKEALDTLQEQINDLEGRNRDASDLKRLYDSIDCSFSKTEGLSNGDKIIYACTFDASAAELARYNISDLVLTYTVSGLKEYQELDPFEGISASWTLGTDYAAVVDLNIPEEMLEYDLEYDYNYGGLEYNGHSIFITVTADEEALRNKGIVLKSDSYEYELGPKPQRITDAEELTDRELENIRSELQTMLEAELEACGWTAEITRGRVQIRGIGESYISRNTAYFSDRTNGFTFIFELDTDSGGLFNLNKYDARFIGQIYRMSDGSIQFLTRTSHACRFSGSFGSFTLEEQTH